MVNGYAYAHADAPKYDRMGNLVGSRSYDLGSLTQGFDLQVRLLPVWAIRAGFGSRIYTGATGDALFGVGSSVETQGVIGTTVSFPVGSIARLGGVLDYRVGPSYTLDIATGIVESLAAKQADLSNLVTTTTTHTFVPGLLGAIAIHKSVGAALAIRYAHSVPSTEGITRTRDNLLFGATVDFDLKAITAVPVGFIGSYELGVPLAGKQNFTSNTLDLGIYYTGRPNFVVGPELSVNWFTLVLVPDDFLPQLPLSREADTTSYTAVFAARYYWQP
jgi:hypothetical protein